MKLPRMQVYFVLAILFAFIYATTKEYRNASYPILDSLPYIADSNVLKKTKYYFLACGDVIMIDRTESKKKDDDSINYYVTYHNEYTRRDETVKVTPRTYKKCKDGLKRVCFSRKDQIYNKEVVEFEWLTLFYGVSSIASLIFIYLLINSIYKYHTN